MIHRAISLTRCSCSREFSGADDLARHISLENNIRVVEFCLSCGHYSVAESRCSLIESQIESPTSMCCDFWDRGSGLVPKHVVEGKSCRCGVSFSTELEATLHVQCANNLRSTGTCSHCRHQSEGKCELNGAHVFKSSVCDAWEAKSVD